MRDLFGNDTPYDTPQAKRNRLRNKDGSYKENPMIALHGIGPEIRCKNCEHIVRKVYAKVYYKCGLRAGVDKSSPVSDHRANWKACGKFLQKNPM